MYAKTMSRVSYSVAYQRILPETSAYIIRNSTRGGTYQDSSGVPPWLNNSMEQNLQITLEKH